MGRPEPTGGAQRPASLLPLSGKTPAAGCGGRARAGPAHPGRWGWPQAGRWVLKQVLVVGSVWPFSPQGWPGRHAPAAGGQGPHSHLLPTGDRSCLTLPSAEGPLEWQGRPHPWSQGWGVSRGADVRRDGVRVGHRVPPAGMRLPQPRARVQPVIQRGWWAWGRGSVAGHHVGPLPHLAAACAEPQP